MLVVRPFEPKWKGLLLCVLITAWANPLHAQDFEAYEALLDDVEAIRADLDHAGNTVEDAVRVQAIEAYSALLEWLDDFLQSDASSALSASEVAAARSDRNRLDYNIATHLTALGECQQARDRLRGLLDEVIEDSELRPLLARSYDEAIACADLTAMGTFIVETIPAGADVFVDGVYLGISSAEHEVEVGTHELRIRAGGFEDTTLEFSVEEPGARVDVGHVTLVAEVTADDGDAKAPTWVEWTLWGGGIAGVGSGIGFYLAARDREDKVDNPPAGEVIIDPAGEQALIDTYDTTAYVTGAMGLVMAVTGTVLYLSRDVDDDPSAVSWGIGCSSTAVSVWTQF